MTELEALGYSVKKWRWLARHGYAAKGYHEYAKSKGFSGLDNNCGLCELYRDKSRWSGFTCGDCPLLMIGQSCDNTSSFFFKFAEAEDKSTECRYARNLYRILCILRLRAFRDSRGE